MRYLVFICLSLLFSMPALAQEYNDALLKDYIGLCKLLRANGVEPVSVNWNAIEPVCLGLKTEQDPIPYNRCRFDKAMDQSLYPGDRNSCSNRARAEFPDSLLYNQPSLTVAKKGGTTVLSQNVASNAFTADGTTTYYQQPITQPDLEAKRASAFDDCMDRKGWLDINNPARGRRRE